MRLILWLIFLVVFIRLNLVEGYSILNTGRWYTVSHTSGKARVDENAKSVKCNYTKYPPKTKLKECIKSANPSNSDFKTNKMKIFAGTRPLRYDKGKKYYMLDPARVDESYVKNKWILMRTDTDMYKYNPAAPATNPA